MHLDHYSGKAVGWDEGRGVLLQLVEEELGEKGDMGIEPIPMILAEGYQQNGASFPTFWSSCRRRFFCCGSGAVHLAGTLGWVCTYNIEERVNLKYTL